MNDINKCVDGLLLWNLYFSVDYLMLIKSKLKGTEIPKILSESLHFVWPGFRVKGNVTIYFYSLLLDILIILSFGVFWELWYHTFPKKDILLITDRWPCYYGPNVQSYQTIYLLVVMFNLLETFFIIMNCTHSFNRVSLSIYFWADCQPESGKQIQRECSPGLQGLPSSTPLGDKWL